MDDQYAPVRLMIDGKERIFDIDNPHLPDWIDKEAFASDNFPYSEKMKDKEYLKEMGKLQIELVKVQSWLQDTRKRVLVLFEGRDAAGKDGTIKSIVAYLNPRWARTVALTKPTETEVDQWYFQRYIMHFPAAGELALFNRSWYNRAGVEPVMGFCTPKEYEAFMKALPHFEAIIVNEGILFFKFWLNIGREMQMKRFHQRRHDPLRAWKLSPMDLASLDKWDEYTSKRDKMLEKTHTETAPWTVVRANDKERAHINVIRHLLHALDYAGKDKKAIGDTDGAIVGSGVEFLKQTFA